MKTMRMTVASLVVAPAFPLLHIFQPLVTMAVNECATCLTLFR